MKPWIKFALYIPRHSKSTDENILRLLVPSLLGILLCMICLAGTTWAWFTASVQTQPQTIEAANYDIAVSITNESGDFVSHGQPLETGKSYKVTLTASGTADKFGGYCIVGCGDVMLYTAQLLPGHTLSFTLTPPETAAYTFTAVWGSHSGETDIKNGSTIGQKTGVLSAPEGPETQQAAADESVYMVRSGDSLWNIAQQHGMDVEKIAAYNDIDKNAVLQIGQEIKIPPADYEITEESVSSSSRQTESHQKADEPAPAGPESAASEPALTTSDTPMQKSENSIPSE